MMWVSLRPHRGCGYPGDAKVSLRLGVAFSCIVSAQPDPYDGVASGAAVRQAAVGREHEVPDMIEVRCPHCGKYLKRPQSYAGKMAECPSCLRMVQMPGEARVEAATPRRPKSSVPARQLCVDCGGSFATGEMLEHNGQMVCTDCFYQRKPVVLKTRTKRGRKRKILLWLLILLAVAAAVAAAVWLTR
jgi:phage FluMu protein Com